jgi:hypothetical protein
VVLTGVGLGLSGCGGGSSTTGSGGGSGGGGNQTTSNYTITVIGTAVTPGVNPISANTSLAFTLTVQ